MGTMSLKKAQRFRGFSLIELMVVVVIIGILAAVAIPSFMDYLKRAKYTEASLQLNKIGKNAKRFYGEHSSYPAVIATATPAKPGSGGCCGGPNNHCADAAATTAAFATPAWQTLDFEISEPTLFSYDYTGTATGFVAQATGDLDCDGKEVVFTLTGSANNGNPTVVLTEPSPNAD